MMKRCLMGVLPLLVVGLVLIQSQTGCTQEQKKQAKPFVYDQEKFATQWKGVKAKYPLVARAYLYLQAALSEGVEQGKLTKKTQIPSEDFATQWKEVTAKYPLVARAYLHLQAALNQVMLLDASNSVAAVSNLPPGLVLPPEGFVFGIQEGTDGSGPVAAVSNLPPGVVMKPGNCKLLCETRCAAIARPTCGGISQCLNKPPAEYRMCKDELDDCRHRAAPTCYAGCAGERDDVPICGVTFVR